MQGARVWHWNDSGNGTGCLVQTFEGAFFQRRRQDELQMTSGSAEKLSNEANFGDCTHNKYRVFKKSALLISLVSLVRPRTLPCRYLGTV